MKVLFIAEKIDKNDEIWGYLHGHLLDLAPQCEKLSIICLEKKDHNLPPSVKILSLGKEGSTSRWKYVINFYKFIWRERVNYDFVFVYREPLWVVLGGPIWRLLGKRIVLWYNHTFVNWRLRIGEKFVSSIITPSLGGVPLGSHKVVISESFLNKEILAQVVDKNKK